MELNLCPACGAFIRGTWTSCQACGVDLGVPAAAETEEVAADAQSENTEFTEVEAPFGEPAPEPQEIFFEVPKIENNTDFDVVAPVESAETAETAETNQVAEVTETVQYEAPAASELASSFEAQEQSLSGLYSFNSDDVAPPAAASAVALQPEPEAGFASKPGVWENSFDGAEPAFTAFSFFESDDNVNSEYAGLASGAPLDAAHNITAPPVEKRERKQFTESKFGAAVTSRRSLVIVGAVAAVIGLLSVLSFVTVLFLNVPAPVNPQVAAPTTDVAADWQTYTSPLDLYTVKLPSDPRVTQDGNSVLMRSEVPNSKAALEVYAVKLDPARNRATDQALLQRQLNATALDRGTAVSSSAFQTVDSTRYLTAHFANGAKTLNGDAQFYIKGNTLYAAWLLTPDDAGDPGVFSRLFDGFKPVNAG